MQVVLRFLLVICLCLFTWVSIPARAQDQTTANLIDPLKWTGQSVTGQYGGSNLRDHVFGCCTGGPGAAVDTTNGSLIWFSWGPATVAQTIAINQALSGTGIKVSGLNYSYDWYNYGYNAGTLTASISMTNNSNKVLESYQWSHPISETDGWKTNSGTKTFASPYSLTSLGNLTMSFSGQDNRFWAGYYGPAIANPSLSLNYGVDTCVVNPLSSPDCPGYASAYFNQQCTISALYNPSCPGYASAYLSQQCQLNALYDPSCPNYATAYAKQNLLNTSSTNTVTTTESTTSTAKTDPVSIATTTTTTSTTSPTSVTSVTSVVSPSTTVNTVTTTTAPAPIATVTPATAIEAKKTDAEIKTATSGSTSGSSAKARAEARAKEVAKEASQAKTLEDQASKQGLVVGLMGFTPGFDAYLSVKITDVNALQMARQYYKPTVDNRSVLRQLSGASERLHNEMVNQQYKINND